MPATLIRNLRWASRNGNSFLLLWVLFVSCAAAADTPAYRERLLLVDINRQQLNQTVLMLADKTGAFCVSGRNLQRWRLRLPATGAGFDYQGERYYPLDAIAGVAHEYDPASLTLAITARPESFTVTTLATPSLEIPLPSEAASGGFINYDLLIAHVTEATQHTGQFELGWFNRLGVGTHNMLATHSQDGTRMTRLESTWTTDMPQRRQTFRVGDAVNAPGTWGRPVRFGGIQYNTNFGTQPGYITRPQQSATGWATLPSTVDILVNEALVSSQQVPPGPFTIGNLPLVTGAGTLQLVVRDMLGREHVVTRNFYASQSLLREGLQDFSYELGFVRENFGSASHDYGDGFGSVTYRRGLSDQLTAEVHAETQHTQTTIGAGGDLLVSRIGTISSHVAISRHREASGGLLLLGFERLAPPWSAGARLQWTSNDFAQLGTSTRQSPPILSASANLGYATARSGTFGFAYVAQLNRGQSDTRLATFNYSVPVGRLSSFNISVLHTLTPTIGTTLFALFSTPLGTASSVSFQGQSVRGESGDNGEMFATTLQQNLPGGEGAGYRLQARSDRNLEASYSWQSNFGTYAMEAAHNRGSNAARLNASGGVALLGGDVFLSRRIGQSFAVVHIADYPNVHVFADNQPAGITDADGKTLLPRLRAYDINIISVDPRDLPLDAQIGSLKQHAIPYFRSGVEIEFPISHANAATFTLHLENGKPLPVGAFVHVAGREDTYAVGYDGEVYVAGLAPLTRLRARWRNQSCEFDIVYVASGDPLPELGIFICKGVKP